MDNPIGMRKLLLEILLLLLRHRDSNPVIVLEAMEIAGEIGFSLDIFRTEEDTLSLPVLYGSD